MLRLLLIPTAAFFAQTTGGVESGWVDALLKGGPFAIVVILILLDKLATPTERDRLRAENAELRGEIKALNEELRTQLVPLLADVAKILSRFENQMRGGRDG